MEQSKLLLGLKTLNDLEFKRFARFVSSAYFNKNSHVVDFVHFLKKRHPNYQKDAVNKEKIYHFLYKGAYNDLKIRQLISQTFALLEKFLISEELETNFLKTDILKLEIWKQRKVDDIFWKTQNIAHKRLTSNNSFDYRYYRKKFEIESVQYAKLQEEGKRDASKNLSALMEAQDIDYLYNKLRLNCELHNRSKVLSVEGESLMEILESPLLLKYDSIHGIRVYRDILILLQAGKEQHYFELKEDVKNCLSIFGKEEYREIFTYLNNYCIQKINTGESRFLIELFENYKFLLEHKIFINNNDFNLFDFKNIATIAIRLEEYDWMIDFTKSNMQFLKPEFQESATSYNLARAYFYKNDYKESLRQLLEVDYSDLYYELGARSLLLKIYYEQNDIDLFYAANDSLQSFIRRHKEVSLYQKETYLNFAKYSKVLFNLKTGTNQKKLNNFKTEISNNRKVADLTWIEQKLSEFKRPFQKSKE
ncbi:MAG: hypothetical protein MRY83_20375 [Flavobacteriales bacterium]|nr:hypothetical protein [Flavobacteriales bacterium]